MTLSFQSMEDAVHLRICLCKVVLKIGEDRSLEDDRRCMCVCVEISILCLTETVMSHDFSTMFAFHFGADFANPIWSPYVIYMYIYI